MAKPPSQQQQQQQLQYQLQQQQLFLHETNPNPNQSTTAAAQIQRQPTRKRQYNGGRKKAEEGGVGEIVEVQGGHIIRSTGRKDRHSKVCTAKGPRDRRVRLSAHTAIQFYDVQDRLGYDRPSKAVDWLLKKAQSSINELDELPPWKPSATNTKTLAAEEEGGGGAMYADNNDESTSLLPPSLDSDSPVQFQSYQSQDLKLSLQSQTHYRNQEEDHQIGFNSCAWDLGGVSYSGSRFMSIPPPLLFGQAAATNHFLSQRGTLQSNNNNTPLPVTATATDDDHHPLSFSGIGFASSAAGFSSFSIPGRYQGDREEEQDANVSNKQSSGSRR